jgi:hypothetical protein
MEELDRTLHAGGDHADHLDREAGILGLHHLLVGSAAVT